MVRLADGSQRARWIIAATVVGALQEVNQGRGVDPVALIPERYRPLPPPERPRTAEEVELENTVAWACLRRAFGRA